MLRLLLMLAALAPAANIFADQLQLISPNGGENWTAGTTHAIVWDTTSTNGYVEISLQRDGRPQKQFIGQAPITDGYFLWQSCRWLENATDYYVTVRRLNQPQVAPLQDSSDANFSISGALPLPELTLTSPIGGETFATDSTQPVTWTSTNPAGDVEIWLTNSIAGTNGFDYEYLGRTAMTAGRFDAHIIPCQPDGTDYSVLLRWTSCDQLVETANTTGFEITGSFTPQITITSPAADDVWYTGTTQTITWNSTTPNGEIELYLRYSGSPDVFIARTDIAAGSIDYLIPHCIDSIDNACIMAMFHACPVRLYGEGSPTSGWFEIIQSTPTTLELTSPTDPTTWPAGTTQTITWNTNLTGTVDLRLPDIQHSFWTIQTLPAQDGQYTWKIPPTLPSGTDYIVEIGSFGSGECQDTQFTASQTITITSAANPFADFDNDGDVDLFDIFEFQSCYTGPGPVHLTRPCNVFDYDRDDDIDDDDYYQALARFYGVDVGDGDADIDGDVDLNDFTLFANCASNPGRLPRPIEAISRQKCLWAFDWDEDGDVDLRDFNEFQQVLPHHKGSK